MPARFRHGAAVRCFYWISDAGCFSHFPNASRALDPSSLPGSRSPAQITPAATKLYPQSPPAGSDEPEVPAPTGGGQTRWRRPAAESCVMAASPHAFSSCLLTALAGCNLGSPWL
ncbi:Hypothetical predicted protein, partial [Marmota monax]